MDLEGKRALVTGGGKRIGGEICEALAAAGCRLAIHYHRSHTEARDLARRLKEQGSEVSLHRADLADPEACASLLADVQREAGPVDLLVNNAAIFPEETFQQITPASWDQVFAVNLRAPFLLSRAFAAQRGSGAPGVIIHLADARTGRTGTDHFAYRLGKYALAEMTRMLALQLAPHVRVNALAPGAILAPAGADADFLDTLAREHIPLRRPGTPGEIAAHLLHLVRSDSLTGVTLPVDGGEFLGHPHPPPERS